MFLPVTPSGLVPVTAVGEPVLVKEVPGGVGKQVVVDLGTLQACLVSEDSAGKLGRLESATFFADQPVILQAIALIRNRREQRFDPRTGRQLDYPAPGIVGRDPHDEKRLAWIPPSLGSFASAVQTGFCWRVIAAAIAYSL